MTYVFFNPLSNNKKGTSNKIWENVKKISNNFLKMKYSFRYRSFVSFLKINQHILYIIYIQYILLQHNISQPQKELF